MDLVEDSAMKWVRVRWTKEEEEKEGIPERSRWRRRGEEERKDSREGRASERRVDVILRATRLGRAVENGRKRKTSGTDRVLELRLWNTKLTMMFDHKSKIRSMNNQLIFHFPALHIPLFPSGSFIPPILLDTMLLLVVFLLLLLLLLVVVRDVLELLIDFHLNFRRVCCPRPLRSLDEVCSPFSPTPLDLLVCEDLDFEVEIHPLVKTCFEEIRVAALNGEEEGFDWCWVERRVEERGVGGPEGVEEGLDGSSGEREDLRKRGEGVSRRLASEERGTEDAKRRT